MKLSVITATYNVEDSLPYLIESLRCQIDSDFEWVVADGASTDDTLEILQSIEDLNIKILSGPDFGIYDALNRAIKSSSGEFYLVVGADDTLYPNAVSDFKAEADKSADIVTASIVISGCVSKHRRTPAWLCGQFHYVSGHAVGTIFRKSLHDNFGLYSKKYPIAADQHFILKACNNGARVKVIDSVVGVFNLVGVSAVDLLGTITEFYRVQVGLGYNKYVQTLLVIARLIKNAHKF
jgi:glycosyltransferase involved in cell wall biosynthesis